jgi:biopolymer transport protein ExbB
MLAMVALAAPAAHGSTARSFADAFLFSRRGDGSLEVLGSAVTWLLLALSIASIALIAQQAAANRRRRLLPPDLVARMDRHVREGRYRMAIEAAASDGSYLGQVLHAAFREARFGFPAMMRALEQSADELATARLRRIELLNIVGQVSPMVGLFGTVYGMILAFGAIVASGGSADPVMLAGGIGTALTTTFWGLVVAIPALAAHAIIRTRIDEVTTEATMVAEEMLNAFRPRAKEPAQAVSVPPAAAVGVARQ